MRAGLRRGLPGFGLIRVLVLAPLLVAPLLWAFYFRSFYSPQFGLFNEVLNGLGLPSVLWVNDTRTALMSLVIADVWQWTPFMSSSFCRPPRSARRRGRGGARRRRRQLAHPDRHRAADAAAGAARQHPHPDDRSPRYLDLVLVITQGGPGRSTEILNYLAYRTAFQEFQFGKGAALAFIVLALVMVAASGLLRVLWRAGDAD